MQHVSVTARSEEQVMLALYQTDFRVEIVISKAVVQEGGVSLQYAQNLEVLIPGEHGYQPHRGVGLESFEFEKLGRAELISRVTALAGLTATRKREEGLLSR